MWGQIRTSGFLENTTSLPGFGLHQDLKARTWKCDGNAILIVIAVFLAGLFLFIGKDLVAVEMAPGSFCSDEVNQQHVRKHACSPRLLESNSRERIKDKILWKSGDAYRRNEQERKCSETSLCS
ncbi:hypothetical protein POM88_024179 [Heracleum sosnowskyi]|uniref:Uncharacterized protein n=1 Tax=Heracleum sosnowskyi TaxID=360622 RepID=A0AAD8I2F8_9APIA|nr:hypothetical protein POM88_024179 [Heracleum sosnowskyi]